MDVLTNLFSARRKESNEHIGLTHVGLGEQLLQVRLKHHLTALHDVLLQIAEEMLLRQLSKVVRRELLLYLFV